MTDESRALKSCPFCGNPVKAGMALTTCPACNAAHHYACWRDQGGCAVPDCTENPKHATPPPAAAATSAAAPSPTPSRRPAPPADESTFEYSVLEPELERLLAEIYLRLREERFAEVAQRLTEAKRLAADHPAVLEAEADFLCAQRNFVQAEALYARALRADPKNALLEEKYAIAVVKTHEGEIIAHVAAIPGDVESPWSNRVARPPWASVVLSLLFPGLGQLYNGDWLKGLALTFAGILCWSYLIWGVKLYYTHGTPITIEMFVAALSQWKAVLRQLLLAALTLYSVIDAYLVAKDTQSLPKLFTHEPGEEKRELKP